MNKLNEGGFEKPSFEKSFTSAITARFSEFGFPVSLTSIDGDNLTFKVTIEERPIYDAFWENAKEIAENAFRELKEKMVTQFPILENAEIRFNDEAKHIIIKTN